MKTLKTKVVAVSGGIAVAAFVGGVASVSTASPAQACVWDAAWFFLHQCNQPPPPPGPPAPPAAPQPLIACDETHCGPDVPVPCSGPGAPC